MILLVQIIATARAVLDCDNVQENLKEDKRNTSLGQNYGPSSPVFFNSSRRNTIKGQNTNLATICGLLASHSPNIHSCRNLDGRNTLSLLALACETIFQSFYPITVSTGQYHLSQEAVKAT